MLKLTILSRLSDTNPEKGLIKQLLKGIAIPCFVPLGDNARKVCDAIRGTGPGILVVHATTAQHADCLYEQISKEMGEPLPTVLTVGITDNKTPGKIREEYQFPSWELAISRFPQIAEAV